MDKTQQNLKDAESQAFRKEWYEKEASNSVKLRFKPLSSIDKIEAGAEKTIEKHQGTSFVRVTNDIVIEWYKDGKMPGSPYILGVGTSEYHLFFPLDKIYILGPDGVVLHVKKDYMKRVPDM